MSRWRRWILICCAIPTRTAASQSSPSDSNRSRRISKPCRTPSRTFTSVMPNSASAERRPVKYDVVHATQYDYTGPVSLSHHVARLAPRTLPRQTCAHHELQIDPVPEVTVSHPDYFGNSMTFFIMQSAHTRLTVRAHSVVELTAPSPPASSTPWEQATERTSMPCDALECAVDATPTRLRAALAAYTSASFPAARPLLEGVENLTARIYDEFTYDPTATN